MFNKFFMFFIQNRAVYVITWKNIVEPEVTDDNVTRRMRIACWITKAANTRSEYVILIAFSTATNVNVSAPTPMLRLYGQCPVLLAFAFYCILACVTRIERWT
jgi:hypothetical protein